MKSIFTLFSASIVGTLSAATSILLDFGKSQFNTTLENSGGIHWNNLSVGDEVPNGVLHWAFLSEDERNSRLANGNPVPMYRESELPVVFFPSLVDAVGNSTGVGFELTDFIRIATYTNAGGMGRAGLEYADDLGPIVTSTGYPLSATIDSIYINWEYEAVFSLTGLADDRTYTLKMWGGQANSTRPSSWIVNGNAEQEQTVETYLNGYALFNLPSVFAQFENVQPVGGVITIKFEQGIEDLGTPNGHWSTLEIIGDFSTPPSCDLFLDNDWERYDGDFAASRQTGLFYWTGACPFVWDYAAGAWLYLFTPDSPSGSYVYNFQDDRFYFTFDGFILAL